LDARRQKKPAGSAVEMAVLMEVELLTEEQYRELRLSRPASGMSFAGERARIGFKWSEHEALQP
jgi:hypothetical protein